MKYVMKFLKLFWIIAVFCIINAITNKCIINENDIFAHSENIGIEGVNGIEYDECEPFGPKTTGTTSSYGEKWYILHSVVDGVDNMSHIDDDLHTVYYRFYNEGSKTDQDWLDDYKFYKEIISFGFSKWNYVSAYKEDENGILQVIPLINLVNVETLENSESVEEHISVYINDDTNTPYSGYVDFVPESEVLEDTQYCNGVKHAHFTKCIINLFPVLGGTGIASIEPLSQTAAHEMGHILGLEDIDYIENFHISDAHHQELLMGYSNEYANANSEITYRDMAGVLVTRGIHTNSDHKWLLDQTNSVDNYKLICSICNCVKYTDSLEGIDHEIYKSCGDNHDLEDGNMMPVARLLNEDYWKCKYCKETVSISLNVDQQYMYLGIYNQQTHTLKNNVLGLEYLVEEKHSFTVDLGDGLLKCNHCPVCNDGSIHVDYDEEITMECVMDEYNDSVINLENESKLYKLNVNCMNNYHIRARGVSEVTLELFDSNLNKLERSFKVNEESFDTVFDGVLLKGTYYLRVRYTDFTDSGGIDLNISSNTEFYKTPIDYLDDGNVLNHMHDSHTEFNYNNNFDRLVEIKLNITADEINIPEGSISITNSLGDIIPKFYTGVTDLAISKEGQNSMIVYLQKNTDYTININLDCEDVTSAILSINMIDSFYFNPFENANHTFIDTNNSLGDYIFRAYPQQYGKYGIRLTYDGSELCDAKMVIITKTFEANNQPIYSIEWSDLGIYSTEFNVATKEFNYNPNNTYFVGIFGGNISEYIHVEFYRKIVNSQNLIMTDPGSDYDCGSEITLNEGSYLGNTLTEGFTRCLFFKDGAPSYSRLDYYWYSSDEDVLEVSIYGTCLAYNVSSSRQVCINAIYKYNQSIVYQIYLTVKNEVNTSPCYIEYNIDLHVGDVYQITADSKWPSTTIQNFTWTCSDSSVALVSLWGTIRPQASGSVVIQGHYNLNERYYIILRVNVI